MRELNLRSLDLNLLVVLDALLSEPTVTRAAQKAGMSQPAMSRALGRLREVLHDPLLVRAPGQTGLLPTARAASLRPALSALLEDVRRLVVPDDFVASRFRGEWRIASTDHQTIMLLPRLMARLAREAPGADVRMVPVNSTTLAQLALGQVDLAFGVAEEPYSGPLRRQILYQDHLVTVVRQNHPALADWTMQSYAALDHVLVTIFDDGTGVMDAVLAMHGLTRRIALRLPHFFAAINVVSTTDLVVTLPASIARRFAQSAGLALVAPPVTRPPFEIVLLWSEVVNRDPGSLFLRGIVIEEARKIPGIEAL